MKKILIYQLAFLLCLVFANAQVDTLVINLKDKPAEKFAVNQIRTIRFENLVSVNESGIASSSIDLKGNYPNPINEQTVIEFEISVPGDVDVLIFDNSGKTIQTLKCSNCQSGKNYLQWNSMDILGNRVQNGIYYYEVHYKHEILMKKMLVIR